ncbi:hypothetical protein D3C72_2195210 [compost metagenome]
MQGNHRQAEAQPVKDEGQEITARPAQGLGQCRHELRQRRDQHQRMQDKGDLWAGHEGGFR